MPVFFQKEIDNDTRLAIWKIEEEEDFFSKCVWPQRNVSHPHKRLQHLAGRYLLRDLFPDFPISLILIADTRKPYLENEAYHFSISHCGDYAAAIVSKTKRVGVDIELVTEKVAKIQHKFVSEEEREAFNSQPLLITALSHQQLTLLWSCKEAIYKWYGLGEVDFKKHMVIQKIKQIPEGLYESEICFQKEEPRMLTAHHHYFEHLVLSYVVTA